MNKLDITKTVIGFVVGAGTTKIVTGIILHNTDPEKVTDKVAIGSMTADLTKKYTSAKIDEIAEWWDKNVKPKLNK